MRERLEQRKLLNGVNAVAAVAEDARQCHLPDLAQLTCERRTIESMCA